MQHAHRRISRFARLLRSGTVDEGRGPLGLGLDLGTGNIVLAAVDAAGKPVAGAWRRSTVVRDGIVVDWSGAVQTVGALLGDLQRRLDVVFTHATVTVPPGIDAPTAKIFTNVAEACGLVGNSTVDEPVAAARALGVADGAVIDIGHGTTGVSILRSGRTVKSVDEPTGGHHMTLVLQGALGLDYDEAEELKKQRSRADMVVGIVRPTLEKMATIAADALRGEDVPAVFLVGGASSFPGVEQLFTSVIGQGVQHPAHPLVPTPLGAALVEAGV